MGINKKYSGSKTSIPNKKKNKTIPTPKTLVPTKKSEKHNSETLDVNRIFDIIESEKRRNDDKTKKSKPNIEIDNTALKSYLKAKQYLTEHNITISTITLDCKLNTLVDIDKFAKNVSLREDGIVSVKYGNRKDPATNRTIVVLKTKKKPSVKNFYNQVTILMKPTNNPNHNYINIKVFKNGSLQMTGCKDMDDFINVANTLIKILKMGKNIRKKNGTVKHIDFINDANNINITDVKIRMINSNFKLDYKVDRKKLAKILKNNHGLQTKDKEIGYIECKYEPTGGHSCVNIKYQYDEKNKPSIFVFQTGAIIITGAKNLHHIIMSYKFILKILNKYYDEIRIVDLDKNMVQVEIANFFKNKSMTNKNEIMAEI